MLISRPTATRYYEPDMLKHMEWCGRNCYNSYDKVTEDSAKPFLNKLIENQHWGVLEHAGVVLPKDAHPTKPVDDVQFGLLAARAGAGGIRCADALRYGFVKDLDELTQWKRDEQLLTFQIRCSRATAAQIDRNRNISVCERSLRYCKFDNVEEFSCCIPYVTVEQIDKLVESWENAYGTYKELLDEGVSADEARYALPLATETTLYVTASKYWWKNIMAIRYHSKASTAFIDICKQITQQEPELLEKVTDKEAADKKLAKADGLIIC